MICAFAFVIIASCTKNDLKSPPAQTKTNATLADTTRPTVKFTFPHNKDTVSDSITIKINSTDNVAVASVQLKVDGVSLGTKTASPYNFGWNTRKVMNGSHQLLAKAVDASGNSTTKKITVHTLNAGVLSMEQDLLNLINAERGNRGLTLLAFDSRIQKAARGHAQDMADNNFFGHTGSDGSSLGTRLDAVGYLWAAAGEDLSHGPTMAIDVYNAWFSNAGQRSIMFDETLRDAAVGCGFSFKNTVDKNFWVLNAGHQ